MYARGFEPSSSALRADIISTAAAPSLIPDELPAVTVPSLLKAGLSSLSAAAVVPARMNSSVSNKVDALARDDLYRGNFSLEPTGLLRSLGLLLRRGGKFVLLAA